MSNQDLEGLFKNAAAGRGMWAGLFPEKPVAIDAGAKPADQKDQHVTLAHFGRKPPSSSVERALLACRTAVRVGGAGPIRARSWATARMDQRTGSVIALLLGGGAIERLRGFLVDACVDVGLRFDATFDFHPHVTLQRIGADDGAAIPRRPRVDLNFRALSLVCGEARVDVDLGEAPF